MSHQPYQQQPGWRPAQPPGWGTPPPRPPKKKANPAVVALAAVGIIGFWVILGTVIGNDSSSEDSKPTPKPPSYEIVEQETSGNKRTVIVEVDSTKGLRKVFDDVAGKLSDEAGYYVMINCSTGGTKDVDNRLANGQYAIGNMGEATTGLKDGGKEFSTNPGRTCPDEN